MKDEPRYVPAAGRRALTRLYDPVLALTTRERHFRSMLRDQVLEDLRPGATVLDVGCGTGTFAIALAALRRDVDVIGVDGDEEVLALARRKSGATAVRWLAGTANQLPLPDGSADAVVMSLLLHHLDRATKVDALAEVRRVLRPGGRLHVADWGRPSDPMMQAGFFLLRCLDGFETTRDNAEGRIASLVAAAGLEQVSTEERLRTAWGTLELLSARSPVERTA